MRISKKTTEDKERAQALHDVIVTTKNLTELWLEHRELCDFTNDDGTSASSEDIVAEIRRRLDDALTSDYRSHDLLATSDARLHFTLSDLNKSSIPADRTEANN